MVSVPCWLLIGWISQMMALLDKPEAVAVQHVVKEIADCYPQALIYPFMISSEGYAFEESAIGQRNQEFVNKYGQLVCYRCVNKKIHNDKHRYMTVLFVCYRLKTQLDRGGVFQEFVDALQQLTNPDMLFKVLNAFFFYGGYVRYISILFTLLA